jgi:hypothetical protein
VDIERKPGERARLASACALLAMYRESIQLTDLLRLQRIRAEHAVV